MKATEEIKAILTQLEQNGQLKAQVVVQLASDPASPLHGYFEWDNAEAGDRYRQDQARALIRSVKMEIIHHSIMFEAPAFVANPAPEGGYTSIVRLRSDEDSAREVIVAEFSRAASALNRARKIAAALGVEEDVDSIQQQIVGLSERVQESQAGNA